MMKHDSSNQNPWAGLSSYEDPAKSEQKLKFCGRDKETKEVARLIDDNFFVTLYGKSGIGKTSLLNAGAFPALRREQYTPLSLRLGMTEETASFQDVITQAIERTIEEIGGSVRIVNVTDEQTELDATDYLWRWFSRRRFLTANGQITFPVLVFDQFEEVFRYKESRIKTNVLLEQLNYLIDESHAIGDCIVDGEDYNYDFNFRFVLSIREDDLYRLEDALDNCALSALKRCRYRLRSLSEQGARDAIIIPGEGLFKEEENNQITQTIIGIARNKEDNSISTNLLSLVCNRLYVESQNASSPTISLSLVDSFVKGNPFERFYNEATRGFSNMEKSYIEEHLVDSTGRRNSIPESDFLVHVKNGTKLIEGKNRILQRISTSSDGGNSRIELIHDSFCEPLAILKEKRERKRRLKWLAIGAVIILLFGGITAFIANMSIRNLQLEGANAELNDSLRIALTRAEQERDAARNANKQKDSINLKLERTLTNLQIEKNKKDSINNQLLYSNHLLSEREIVLTGTTTKLLMNQSRSLAERAIDFLDKGDSYSGKILALNALPPLRPYTPEAEYALRKTVESNSAVLIGHKSNVLHISINHESNLITTSSSDETMKVWNIYTGQLLNTWDQKGWCHVSTYSPNGNLLVSPYFQYILFRNPQNGEVIDTLKGHTGGINSIQFNKEGDKMVTTSQDKTLIVWNTQEKKPIFHLKGHTSFTEKAVFSPDGKYIASASWDKTIIIWDSQTGDSITTLKGHTNYVEDVDYSPDGKYIASASRDNTIIIWDAINGERVHTLSKHTKQVNSVKYNKDGTMLVSASEDGTVMLWDPLFGEHIKTFTGHTDYVHHAVFSSDDKQIISASRDMTIRIWDVYNEEEYETLGKYTKSFMVCINEDGNIIALLPTYIPSIYNLNSKKHLFTLNEKTVHDIVFSPTGTTIATASHDGSIKLWNSLNGNLLYTLPVDNISLGKINELAFSPDGNHLVSGQTDGSIFIWDIKNKKIVQEIKGHRNEISSLAFFPDGERFLSASSDCMINVWDLQTGKLHKTLDAHTAKIHSLAISRHGDFFVSGSVDKKIIIWDAESLSPRKIIDGHNSTVYSVAISRDDNYIVSAHHDKKVRVWDSASGYLVKSFDACTTKNGLVTRAIFNKNGDKIIIASESEGVKMFDFPPLQQLIDETRERFKNRPLTPEERRKYYLE